jgi:hypothetical protein
MASLSLDEETPEQALERMARELDHVSEQAKTSHRMFVHYKAEYEKAERLRARMERSLQTWRKKLTEQPKGQEVTHHDLDLWATEAENPDQISL